MIVGSPMTYDEYLIGRQFIENKALALLNHEKTKAFAKAGFPIDNYKKHIIEKREFYSIRTNTFKIIVDKVYLEAHKRFPNKFGTGNADDVIKAIYEIEPQFSPEDFTTFLQNEQFAYVIEKMDGEVAKRILRIDLFRQLNLSNKNKKEFTGGIFHALKHFSNNGKNLSTGSQIYDIPNIESIIELTIKAFYIAIGQYENSSTLVTTIDYCDNHNFKFVFYLEENTQIFFVKTIHQVEK